MSAEQKVTVSNVLGLHVRPSARLAEVAATFSATVQIFKDGQSVNAKSSIDLLTLAAVQNTELTIHAEGDDEEAAVRALVELIQSGFGEL